MSLEILEGVGSVSISVLEKYAFVFADAVGLDEAGEPVNVLLAKVAFCGAAQGELQVAMPMDLAAEIAANVLGSEPSEVTPALLNDAVGELGNVLCGNLLKALTSPDKIFDLQPPLVTAANSADWQTLVASPQTLALDCDGQVALVQFNFKG